MRNNKNANYEDNFITSQFHAFFIYLFIYFSSLVIHILPVEVCSSGSRKLVDPCNFLIVSAEDRLKFSP